MDLKPRFSFSPEPEPDSPGNRLLANACRLRLELHRIRGQLTLLCELESSIVSAAGKPEGDDEGIASVCDKEVADDETLMAVAGGLLRTMAAKGKGGDR